MEIFSYYRSGFLACIFLLWGITVLASAPAELSAKSFPADDTVQQETLISQEMFSLFLGVNTQISAEELEAHMHDIEAFTRKLAKRQSRYRSEKQFLEYAFYKIHNRYMKRYSEHTDLYDLLDKGEYDCITGTAFYGLILDALDIRYTIKELPYHVYLLVQLQDEEGTVLLESTDARAGFVEDPERIHEMMALYAQDIQSDKADHYRYNFEINSEIDLKQLAALNYYNEAIVYYNAHNLSQATHYLNYAAQLYPARRMQTLRMLIDQVSNRQMTQAGR